LNEEGRKEVAKVFLEVAEKYPEALGYNIEELKEKLKKVIREQLSNKYLDKNFG